jgi:hypothetical protein
MIRLPLIYRGNLTFTLVLDLERLYNYCKTWKTGCTFSWESMLLYAMSQKKLKQFSRRLLYIFKIPINSIVSMTSDIRDKSEVNYITANVKLINNGTAPCVTIWKMSTSRGLLRYSVLVQKTVRIDFRKFINGKPTIQGFYLKVKQWNYLKRLQKYIDLSIKETT